MNRPPKRYENPRKTIVFVFIAAILMVVTDFAFDPPFRMHIRQTDVSDVPAEKIPLNSEIADYELGKKMTGEDKPAGFTSAAIGVPQPDAIKNNAESIAKIIQKPASLQVNKNIIPPVSFARSGADKVVIIIDDMGMDRKRSHEALELPGPLTLSFLPYAPQLPEITKEAMAHGHELLIHAPMAPLDARLDPGPLALRDGMMREDFDDSLDRMFNSFQGYVGMNNHMGSKLTQETEQMNWVMEALAKRNLLFVDSKTIANSVAEKVAAEHGLAHASRDVFLDNENTAEEVNKGLRELEVIAHRRGYAIAIGHPRDATIAALKEWLPELKGKNLVLVPVSAIARRSGAAAAISYGPLDNH